MPTVEIIAIGTELLLGEIQDTNSRYIAREMRDAGMDLYWTSSVGDNESRIAASVRRGLERSDLVITTGGLGPTVDDVTRQGVARAVEVEVEYRPELWDQIVERFRSYGREPTENNKRQAFIPQGAIPLRNPVGTAPAFIVETGNGAVISLPGVPREMEHLMSSEVLPYIRRRFDLNSVIALRIIRTSGAGESQIDARIGDLERMHNPTVGLAAHSGQVDVRITAKAESLEAAQAMIAPLEAQIRRRLGDWVYGADEDTLERVVLKNLAEKGWRLVVLEAGLQCGLIYRLSQVPEVFQRGEVLPTAPDPDTLLGATIQFQQASAAEVALGVALHPGEGRQEIHMALVSPDGERLVNRSYGGPPDYATRWATNLCLDLLRRI